MQDVREMAQAKALRAKVVVLLAKGVSMKTLATKLRGKALSFQTRRVVIKVSITKVAHFAKGAQRHPTKKSGCEGVSD